MRSTPSLVARLMTHLRSDGLDMCPKGSDNNETDNHLRVVTSDKAWEANNVQIEDWWREFILIRGGRISPSQHSDLQWLF